MFWRVIRDLSPQNVRSAPATWEYNLLWIRPDSSFLTRGPPTDHISTAALQTGWTPPHCSGMGGAWIGVYRMHVTPRDFQVGGATGRVGDPSGRVQEREEMAEERLAANTASLTRSLQQIFLNDQEMRGGPDAV